MKLLKGLLVVSLSVFYSCQSRIDLIISDKNVIETGIEEISFDIQLMAIKSSQPIKDISLGYTSGKYDFLLASNGSTVYCVEGDSVVSILDKKGRGRDEYLYITTLAYSPEDSLLYVVDADKKMLIYKLPENKLVKSFEDLPAIHSLKVIDNNRLLAKCFASENDLDERYGFLYIDTKTGMISDMVFTFSNTASKYLDDTNITQCEGSVYFVLGSNDVNQFYSYTRGKFSPQLNFMYSRKLRIPERVRVKDPDNLNEQNLYAEYVSSHKYCIGAFFPISYVDGKKITFWSIPDVNNGDYILNRIMGDEITSYHITIPGYSGLIRPTWVSNGYYVYLYQGASRDENYTGESPLANKIDKLFQNNDGNPVVVKFKVK